MNQEYFMRLALEAAKKGDWPYGAVIVKDDEVVEVAYNTVQRNNDPSAHAEMNVIRSLANKLKNPSLEGYSIYTTCEPCPMCTTVCIWAGISEITYGVSIQDLISINQSQIHVFCEEIIAKSFRKIKVTKGILKDECLALFMEN
ncbi:nucleoside deaminase [Nostoc sp. PCC 7107]|uniref:nucleoside deaminase n=1 Tax=Nostoc sp. PCC 7107 TaxID=317936 RepID=UPI0002ECA6A3|nr:nucleoside deaminase [Nostoc sp. PCC 7107]